MPLLHSPTIARTATYDSLTFSDIWVGGEPPETVVKLQQPRGNTLWCGSWDSTQISTPSFYLTLPFNTDAFSTQCISFLFCFTGTPNELHMDGWISMHEPWDIYKEFFRAYNVYREFFIIAIPCSWMKFKDCLLSLKKKQRVMICLEAQKIWTATVKFCVG